MPPGVCYGQILLWIRPWVSTSHCWKYRILTNFQIVVQMIGDRIFCSVLTKEVNLRSKKQNNSNNLLVRRLLSNTLHLILKSTNPSRPLYIDFVLLAWKSHLHYSKGVDGWSDEKPARINPFTSQNFECRPAWLKSCQTSTNQRNHHCSSIYTIYYLLSIINIYYLLSIIDL